MGFGGFEQVLVAITGGSADGAQSAPPQPGGVQVTSRYLLRSQIEASQRPHGLHSPASQTPSLGSFPVQGRVSIAFGLGPEGHGQLTVRVRVCWPSTPQAVALHSLHSLHAPTSQGRVQVLVAISAGLVDWSQSAPPQPGGEQVTVRLLL